MQRALKSELLKLSGIAFDEGLEKATDFILNTVNPAEPKPLSYAEGSVNVPTVQGMIDAVKSELYRNGVQNKIAAIKLHRTLTYAGLKESKEWVEETFGV